MIAIKKLVNITHTHRNFKRYLEIIHVSIKYGFGGFIGKLPLHVAARKIRKALNKTDTDHVEIVDMPMEVRFRKLLETLGPTFIKFGQILSTRTDLIPAEFAIELSKLQDDAPIFSREEATAIIKKELKIEKIEEIFDDFNFTPLAAASIGQVYRAKYRGQDVVVKVQRPDIEKIIEIDLEIMMHMSLLGEKHVEEIHALRPSAIVEEFAKSMEKEIDFRNEAKETKRFLENIRGEKGIYCPRIIDELTTTRIMVSEFIDGIKPNNAEEIDKGNFDRQVLAENSVDSVLKQIFVYGFFHADPHPGNILIMPDNIVCFIDFGMVGKVSPVQKQYFASLIMNVINKNSNKIVDILLKLTNFDVEPDRDALERDLFVITDEYLLQSLKELDFGKYLSALMDIFARFRLRMKPEIFLLLKSLVSLEKTGKILAPDVNIIEKAEPFVRQVYKERFNTQKIVTDMLDPVNDLMLLVNDLPDDLRTILKKLKSGKFKIDVNYPGHDSLRKTVSRVSNKIALSIVLAALIIGQALILAQPPATTVNYIMRFGKLGFVVTVIIGFCFLFSFFKKKDE